MAHQESRLAGKALSISLNSKLDVSQQCSHAAKANGIMGCNRNRGDASSLLSTTKRHLECWIHHWAPQYETDLNILQ